MCTRQQTPPALRGMQRARRRAPPGPCTPPARCRRRCLSRPREAWRRDAWEREDGRAGCGSSVVCLSASCQLVSEIGPTGRCDARLRRLTPRPMRFAGGQPSPRAAAARWRPPGRGTGPAQVGT
jgi:hypothetical protein